MRPPMLETSGEEYSGVCFEGGVWMEVMVKA